MLFPEAMRSQGVQVIRVFIAAGSGLSWRHYCLQGILEALSLGVYNISIQEALLLHVYIIYMYVCTYVQGLAYGGTVARYILSTGSGSILEALSLCI